MRKRVRESYITSLFSKPKTLQHSNSNPNLTKPLLHPTHDRWAISLGRSSHIFACVTLAMFVAQATRALKLRPRLLALASFQHCLHRCLSLPCVQQISPPQSKHWKRSRPCWQIPVPPHRMQRLFCNNYEYIDNMLQMKGKHILAPVCRGCKNCPTLGLHGQLSNRTCRTFSVVPHADCTLNEFAT